jgi:hypothetical protein
MARTCGTNVPWTRTVAGKLLRANREMWHRPIKEKMEGTITTASEWALVMILTESSYVMYEKHKTYKHRYKWF